MGHWGSQTELERQESHRQAQRRAAQLGLSPKKTKGAAVDNPPHFLQSQKGDADNVTEPVTDTNQGVPASPNFIHPNFQRMPPELTQRPNWVRWVPIWNGSKWTKRPIQPSGFGASTTDPKHWSSFDAVKKAYEWAVECGYAEFRERAKPIQQVPIGGVGFVFDGQPDPDGLVFAGVDFDKINTEIASQAAAERIKKLGSYVEASVSGTGLHVILKARPLASGVTNNGIELYTSGRFFTMTGRTGSAVRSIIASPVAFTALAEELQNQAGHRAVREANTPPGNVGRFKLPQWALNSKPAAAFDHLPVQSLAKGLETNIEEIRSAVSAIPASAIATEPEWMKLARGLAHEAAVFNKKQAKLLEEILDKASRGAPGYNERENHNRFQRYVSEALNREKPITISTVFHMAVDHGWDGRSQSTRQRRARLRRP